MITYADIQQALTLSHEDLTNDPNIGPFMDGFVAGLRLAQMKATEDNASYDEFLMGLPENHAS